MTFLEIIHDSKQYNQMVKLRREILRKPLGLDFTYEELLAERHDFLLGCFENGELIACCILSNPHNDYIKLRQMAVNQDHQLKGIGKLILKFAEKTASEMGFCGINLHARTSACIFYEKQGYLAHGKIFEEVGIPHLRMEKKLK